MKLPQIQYRRVATPNAPGPGMALTEYAGKQKIFDATLRLGEQIAADQVEYQTAAANAKVRDSAIELQTALAGRDELTRDELLSLGASEDNEGIQWQDADGNNKDKFRKHEVETALLAGFFDQQIEEYGAGIASPKARSEWTNSVKSVAAQEIARTAERASGQAKAYEYRSTIADMNQLAAEGRYAAMLELAKTSPAFAANPQERQKWIAEAQSGVVANHMTAITSLADDGIRAAREGNTPMVGTSLAAYDSAIDELVRSGAIANPAAAESMKESMRLDLAIEGKRTEIRQSLDSDNDVAAAAAMIAEFRDADIPNMTVEKQEEVFQSLVSDLNLHLSLRTKEETAEKAASVEQSKAYSKGLYLGILNNETTASDITFAVGNDLVTQEEGEGLIRILNNRGRGIDDYSLVNSIRQMMADGDEADEIRQVIAMNTGGDLTENTALSLMDDLRGFEAEESPLKTNESRRAMTYIQKSISVTGIMGQLDPNAEKRLAEAQRDFSNRVLAGDNPFEVADELVDRDSFERLPEPQYGTKDDVQQARQLLDEAANSGLINQEDYDYQWRLLEDIEKQGDNIKAFDKDLKESRNANQ